MQVTSNGNSGHFTVLMPAHEQEALQVLYQLKETVDKQRDQLHAKDDELTTRALEVDAVSSHSPPDLATPGARWHQICLNCLA